MKKYRVIDLFSGAGGLTFGFHFNLVNNEFVKRENIEFIFANEYAPYAAEAFRKNYPEVNMIEGDIQKITDEDIQKYTHGQEVDVIIGGPPCQSFSTIGQRKYDDRAKLSNEYLRILESVKPKMFLFENVKGILSMREIFYKTDDNGEIVLEDVVRHRGNKTIVKKEPVIDHYGDLVMNKLKDEFDRIGYKIVHETKNAYDFGVPQNRERVIIIGIRKDLNLEWAFPQGVGGRWTVEDAISDLPEVGENQHVTNYDKAPSNSYQELMRRNSDSITEHYCGIYGDKIRTVIRHVKEGQGKDDFNALVDQGIISEDYRLTSGYGNTYGRLIRSKPSPTITNNLSTPSGTRCIHYAQHRALTPREGARIQSFPDWFQFVGTKDAVTKQIGNAVPPLLAIALINKIIETLA